MQLLVTAVNIIIALFFCSQRNIQECSKPLLTYVFDHISWSATSLLSRSLLLLLICLSCKGVKEDSSVVHT